MRNCGTFAKWAVGKIPPKYHKLIGIICAVFLVSLFVCVLCNRSNTLYPATEPRQTTMAVPAEAGGSIGDIPVDNTTSLEKALHAQYTLAELDAFFGVRESQRAFTPSLPNGDPTSPHEWQDTYDLYNWELYRIEEVNKVFPIEVLRKTVPADADSTECAYYTVFRVSEGGYYYVFWQEAWEGSIYDGISVRRAVYLNNLPSAEDLKAMNGNSTLADVYSISRATVFIEGSAFCYSYTLMDTGDVYRVYYDWPTVEEDPAVFKMSDFSVDEYWVDELEWESNVFGKILTADLP